MKPAPNLPPSTKQKRLVRESFESIQAYGISVVVLFYGRLFEIAPETRALFQIDIREQSKKLLALPDGSNAKLRIVLEVQDTHTGEIIASVKEDGSEGELPELVSAGGDHLRRALGIGSLSTVAAREVRASAPSNSEAERFYAKGLAHLESFDALTARSLFEKANRC